MAIFKNRPLAAACAVLLGALILSCLFLTATAAMIVAVSVGLICLFLAVLLLWRGYSYPKLYLLLLALGLSLGCARSAMYLNKDALFTEKIGQTVVATLEVEEVEHTNTYSAELIVRILEMDGAPAKGRAVLIADFSSPFYRGDRVKGCFLVEALDFENYYEGQEYDYRARGCSVALHKETTEELSLIGHTKNKAQMALENLRFRLSGRISGAIPGEAGNLLNAMLLGIKDDVLETTTRNFRRAGVSHLLAISGLHIGILAALCERILYFLRVRKRSRIGATALLMLGYLVLTGATPSTVRAVLMLSLVFLAFFFKSRADALTSLLLVASLILAIEPYAFYGTSYQLTVLATFGILAFERVQGALSSLFPYQKSFRGVCFLLLRGILTSLSISLFAAFAILPIQWLTFGEIATITPLSNLVLIPLAAPFLLLGIATLCFYPIPPFAFLTKGIGTLILHLVEGMAAPDTAVSLSFDFVPYVIFPLLGIGVLLLVIDLGRHWGLALTPLPALIAVFAVCLLVTRAGQANEIHAIYRMNGKNESIGLLGNDGAVLLDFSSGSSTQLSLGWRSLRELGATELDVLVLTHYHKAQIAAFSRFSERTVVHSLWLPSPASEGELAILESLFEIAHQNGISVSLYNYGISTTILTSGTLVIGEPLFLSRSTEPALDVTVTFGDTLLYYESAALSEYRRHAECEAAVTRADYYILGAHGPVPHEKIELSGDAIGIAFIPNEKALLQLEVRDGCRYLVFPEKYRFVLQ